MKNPTLLYRFVIIVVKWTFKIFYRHKIYGLEHYPSGSALIAANHTSHLDPPAIAISCPGEIHFLARRTLFKSSFGKLIQALNSHPIEKEATNLRVMKEVCTLLKEGKKVLMFPEGTRSKDDTLKKMKPGIGLLLSKGEAAIIPTYVHGTFGIWNRDRKFPKLWGRTAVVFGTPIEWSDYVDMERKEAQKHVAQRLKKSLEELRKWLESGAQGTPP